MIVDVAVTGIDGQYRASDDAPDHPFNVHYEQKTAKLHRVADENVSTVFSHTGQIHQSIMRLMKEQIRHKLIFFEGEAKQSKMKSIMKW